MALAAALTGYGVMARDNGLDLTVTVVSVLSLWGLPAMMTYAELVGASSGPVLMAVTIALINIRTLPMVDDSRAQVSRSRIYPQDRSWLRLPHESRLR